MDTQAVKTEEVLLGYCDVDSGQILLCDPCYIKEDFASEGGVNFDAEGEPLSYDGCCTVTVNGEGGQLNHKMGHAGAGVAVPSGYGDGSYPVYGTFRNAGDGWGRRCVAVRIDFDPPMDQDAA